MSRVIDGSIATFHHAIPCADCSSCINGEWPTVTIQHRRDQVYDTLAEVSRRRVTACAEGNNDNAMSVERGRSCVFADHEGCSCNHNDGGGYGQCEPVVCARLFG